MTTPLLRIYGLERVGELLAELQASVEANVTVKDAGVSWWCGGLEDHDRAVLTDYLIGLTRGVLDSLLDQGRSVEVLTHHSKERAAGIELVPPGKVVHHGSAESRARQELDWKRALRNAYISLGHCLDQLTAMTLIVAGVESTPRRAMFSQMDTVRLNKRLMAPTSLGGAVQRWLISDVLQACQSGPTGWLDWSIDLRNQRSHRAPRLDLQHPVTQSPVLVPHAATLEPRLRVFLPRNPKRTDFEEQTGPLESQYIWEPAEDVTGGIFRHTRILAERWLEIIVRTWSFRADNPAVIPQPPAQWGEWKRDTAPGFRGFDDLPPPHFDVIVTGPRQHQRFQGLNLDDATRGRWSHLA